MTTNSQMIDVERIATGTVVYLHKVRCGTYCIPNFRASVEVVEIEFDGEGYALTISDGTEWTDTHYVKAGEQVTCPLPHRVFLREEADIGADELEAKAANTIVAVMVITWSAPINTGYRVTLADGSDYPTPVYEARFAPYLADEPMLQAAE